MLVLSFMLQIYSLTLPANPTIEQVMAAFEKQSLPVYALEQVNWPQSYPYCPQVSFSMAYAPFGLMVRFQVKEDAVLATFETDTTARTWEDSCVELFLKTAPDAPYYNFEFNCIGTCHAAMGNVRTHREQLKAEDYAKILRYSSLGNKAFGLKSENTQWTLYIAIPWSVMGLDQAPKAGDQIQGNLYKCGDKTPVPHYVSWSPIGLAKPNFHVPEFFGTFEFK